METERITLSQENGTLEVLHEVKQKHFAGTADAKPPPDAGAIGMVAWFTAAIEPQLRPGWRRLARLRQRYAD